MSCPKRVRSHRGIAASLVALGILALAPDAEAFCRSTTCRTANGKECPTDENGCTTQGAQLYWPTSCVSYATNRLGTAFLDPEETRDAIRKTFQAWSDVECPDGTIA